MLVKFKEEKTVRIIIFEKMISKSLAMGIASFRLYSHSIVGPPSRRLCEKKHNLAKCFETSASASGVPLATFADSLQIMSKLGNSILEISGFIARNWITP